MGRTLKTIYEYFNEYSVEEINFMLEQLSVEEKTIIKARYGEDLYNPVQGDDWNKNLSEKFYGSLIPKMKRILKNNSLKDNKDKLVKEIVVSDNNKKINTDIELEIPKKEEIEVYPNLLIEEIKKGKSNEELCKKFNISSDILYKALLNLQNNGIESIRKYYSDGSINYKLISSFVDFKKHKYVSHEKTIITDRKEYNMKFLVISDLHFGNCEERIDLVDRAFNYCAKNGINSILCGGDFIDGTFTHGKQNISGVYKQIDYFIKNYPSDKNILTYGVAGDHDFSAFTGHYLNLVEICNNLRHDIIIGGYNNASIAIKNDFIHLYHYLVNGEMLQNSAPIILHGHSHKYATSFVNDVLNITIPTLSNIATDMPTALELDVSFYKGYIKTVTVRQIYFGDKDIVLNEQTHDLLKNRTVNYTPVKNIEAYKAENKILTKVK